MESISWQHFRAHTYCYVSSLLLYCKVLSHMNFQTSHILCHNRISVDKNENMRSVLGKCHYMIIIFERSWISEKFIFRTFKNVFPLISKKKKKLKCKMEDKYLYYIYKHWYIHTYKQFLLTAKIHIYVVNPVLRNTIHI